MARGAVRSFAAAWLGLVVLQTATTKRGSGAIAGGFGVIGGLAERLLSPDVPAIPNRAHATGRDAETDAPAAATGPRSTAPVVPRRFPNLQE